MTYDIDLRERVVKYVHNGGSQMEAVRLFEVDRKTIYHWLRREDLSPTVVKTRERKLDKSALAAHVRDYPDALLRERSEHFGVTPSAIWRSIRRLNIRKKNDEV